MAWQKMTTPSHFGAMSPRGLRARQDEGYYPDTTDCGDGATCQEACGAQYEECSGATPICYDPTVGQKCCNDGTGYGCNAGDYCTNDSAGLTYCCPDGLDLAGCAAAYSLTGGLNTVVPTPTATATEQVEPTFTATDDNTAEPTATESLNTEPAETEDATATEEVTATVTEEATVTGTAGSPEFTGGAAKMAKAGMAVLAGAAVFL